ncbi:MAG TPA: tRNA (adenosine(37)-N6)-dimethylallyltransferase MiaA [Candidatus Paceibacterota bacterium]|nr:tRNA (adenosine(37)-N6)-dimethylallyltransferase MiaA [Candidatus Paceibacterota bacterium]HRZ34383.1 tRNA (adenosine(37)-N6)-dimethylallyltransferase MiaA [Candidatus Paceibacterota bacterium]
MKPKILVILGPTSSGKSDLAVKLARKSSGEIISADSRQVYKGLDIGSGKITKKEMRGVPHHLLDIVSPKKVFSVADYQKIAEKKIKEILSRKKLPIICGGTGFYISSIVDGLVLPKVPENKILRKKLQKLDLVWLQNILKKLDADRFKEIDTKNPARLIRAIEIASALGKVPPIKSVPKYECLQIGLSWPKEKLEKRIRSRLLRRIRAGLIPEVQNLHKKSVSWKRLYDFGLEYRYVSLFLQNKLSKKEMFEKLTKKICQYAKRQMTWFKRDKRIVWIKPQNIRLAEKLVANL